MEQKNITVGLGAALLVALGGVYFITRPSPPPSMAPTASAAAPSASASAVASAEPEGSGDAGSEGGADSVLDMVTAPAGSSQLPPTAPKQVGFGVVLFVYEGAQAAPPGSRSKAEALTLARAAVETAKKDFAEAVKQGDRGSLKDAGRVPRGILEDHIELTLFTLDKGQVADEPIDTPRGYWVVKRND